MSNPTDRQVIVIERESEGLPPAGIAEAPQDGKTYCRKNAAWVEVSKEEASKPEAPRSSTEYVTMETHKVVRMPIYMGEWFKIPFIEGGAQYTADATRDVISMFFHEEVFIDFGNGKEFFVEHNCGNSVLKIVVETMTAGWYKESRSDAKVWVQTGHERPLVFAGNDVTMRCHPHNGTISNPTFVSAQVAHQMKISF